MTAYFPKNKKNLHLFKAWSISPSPKGFSEFGADNRNLSFISIPFFSAAGQETTQRRYHSVS
jgi:hypothetical protein